MAANERLVVTNCVTEFVVLHEKDMGYVKLPGFMFTAKLSTLAEDFFNHVIVGFVPVYFRLHHKDWDVLVKSLVIFRQSTVDRFAVSCNSCILNSFRLFSQSVNVLRREVLEFSVRLLLGCLVKNEILQEFKITL